MRPIFYLLLLALSAVGAWILCGRRQGNDSSKVSKNINTQTEESTASPSGFHQPPKLQQTTSSSSGAPSDKPERPSVLTSATELAAPNSAPMDSGKVDRDGLVRDETGALQTMRFGDAVNWCASRGLHLATIRELVTWGSKVIKIEKIDEIQVPQGFYKELIRATNPDGTKDEFYVIYKGSGGDMGHEGNVGRNWFFSSSADTDHPDEFWAFDGRSNYVPEGENPDPDPRYHFAGVRCLPNLKKETEKATSRVEGARW